MKQLSDHDQCELDSFRRLLTIRKWREDNLGESHYRALGEACLEVYGDREGEGNKHQDGLSRNKEN